MKTEDGVGSGGFLTGAASGAITGMAAGARPMAGAELMAGAGPVAGAGLVTGAEPAAGTGLVTGVGMVTRSVPVTDTGLMAGAAPRADSGLMSVAALVGADRSEPAATQDRHMNPADNTGRRGSVASATAFTGTGLVTAAHGESAHAQRTAT
ncbi:hypothetical protein ACFY1L_01365 [Streptomyces sp. NPDC001663]|uniref:hypothetical protein n=1 Tax=Streptomyces sp. NPDC001663 TaxID=3364597 RepID=UPI0036967EA7